MSQTSSNTIRLNTVNFTNLNDSQSHLLKVISSERFLKNEGLNNEGVFSEFETNLRKERQMEGVRKAKELGVYKGRGRTIDASQIYELKQNGYGATKISKELGITRQSVYRLLKEQPVQSVSI